MANTDYKSPDALMWHLRDNGISISGSSQKQQLINTGYFHGYKGYRFFVSSSNRLPFTSYNEINATIQYDTKLKSLLYGKMMFIETALKNIALNTIMSEIDSSSIYDMYDKAISIYKNAPTGTREDIKKKYVHFFNITPIFFRHGQENRKSINQYTFLRLPALYSHTVPYNLGCYIHGKDWTVYTILLS